MRLVPIGLYVLACAFSYALVEAEIKEEKIFKKKLDDHQTLTSGYAYHHLSTSVLPRGFEANKVHHDVDGLAGSASQGDHSVIHETAGGLGASGGDHGGDAGHSVAAVYKFSVVHGTGGDGGGEHGSADYNSDNGVVNTDGAHHGEHDDIAAMIGRYSMALDSNVVHGVGDNVKLEKVDGTKGKADAGGDEIASALSGSYKTELTNFDLGKSGSSKSNDVEGQSATTGDGVSNYVSAPHHAASDGHDEGHDHEESDEQDDDYGGYGDFDGHYWDFGGTDDPYYGDHDDHGYFDFYGDFGFYDHYGDHSVGGNYGGGEGHTGHAGGGGHGGQEGGGGHGGYGDHGGHRGGGGGGHGGHGGGGGGIGGHYSDVGNAYHASNYFDHVFEDDKGRKGHRLFDDGLHDHYDKEGYKNFHVEDGGSEKDHHDEDEVHGDHHEFEKGSKDGHFDEKKGHDKGTKTKGYHNVLHKDEYTKEHTFYDNAHRGGHFIKDGDFDTHFHVAAGDNKKGEHHDSAYDFDHSGKKDYKDKGHLLSDHIGHDNKEGFDSHHHFETDFGHKGAGRHGKDYGFWNHHGDEHKSDHGGS